MAVQPTNLARLCTAKWQPIYVAVEKAWEPRLQYCQVFVSPYNWDAKFYYNNKWNEALGSAYVYEGNVWRAYDEDADGSAVAYSNKRVITEPTPASDEEEEEWGGTK